MSKMNTQGFTPIHTVLIGVVVIAVAAVGVYAYNSSQDEQKSSVQRPSNK